MTKESQCKQILEWLGRHSLNQGQASYWFGCSRLAARIKELKQRGHQITTEMVTVRNRAGRAVRIAEYKLIKGAKK